MRRQGWDKRLPDEEFARLVKDSAMMIITKGGRARRCWMKFAPKSFRWKYGARPQLWQNSPKISPLRSV